LTDTGCDMERTIGVDRARARLGQLAEEIATDDEPVILTRRGEAVAVLVSPAEYDRLVETSRQAAREELRTRLAQVRQSVADAGLDVSVVDEAITAARAAE
jgi:prevent-host-death family protein